MKYFGLAHDAPVYESAEFAETPVGEECLNCHVEIELGDDGFLVPYFGDGFGEVAYHRRCFLREVIGPLADEISA